MKETKRTANIIEMSSFYDDAVASWFINNDAFPSKLDYRTFIVDEKAWNVWISNNVNIIKVEHGISPNSTGIKIKSVTGKLVYPSEVIMSWKVGQSSKGKLEISRMSILYDYDDNVDIDGLDYRLNELKLSEEKRSSVYMVVQRPGAGLDLQDFEIDIPTLDIVDNYGNEWAEKHEKLIESLTTKKRKGIALLHGLPGTGKSMYIRSLISMLSENRTVVYLPNQLINCITDPGFIPLMAEYSGAILVIEDADEAIKSRKNGGGTVDKLLNLADGILSDFLGMQIICTFNNDLSSIDDALLRKGRLILKHEFNKLSIEASQKLSNKLGFKTTIEEEMTLAEIYNQDDTLSDIDKKEVKQIGFGR